MQTTASPVREKTREELINDLYNGDGGVFLFNQVASSGTGIEEIDTNSWEAYLRCRYNDGRCEKMEEHFENGACHRNVISKIVHVSGMVLDNDGQKKTL